MDVSLPRNWRPRPYQLPLWKYLAGGGKRAVALWHRRAGKDEVCLHHAACAAHERVGNYVHMLPEYSQARKAIWDAVNPHSGKRRIDEAFPVELRAATRDHEMAIRLSNGSTWQLAGSDSYNALMGTSFAGMVMSEYALSNPEAWGYFAPILLENNGWALFITTPRGHNHAEAMLKSARRQPDWFHETLTVDDTGVFSRADIDAELARLQELHGEAFGRALWLQEYFVSFDAAVPGSIWGDSIAKLDANGRIAEVSLAPGVPVSTGWDLGRTDDTAIWFYQCVGTRGEGEIRVVDYHASNFKEIPFYGQLLRDWALTNGAEFDTHWLPHDARPRRLGMGGKSILQQLQEELRKDRRWGRCNIAPRLDVEEGIQAARATFKYCRFDRARTEKGLDCLRAYQREWDAEAKIFSTRPLHNWASHGSDAWRTVALTWRFAKATVAPELPVYQTEQTFGAMRKAHLAKKRKARDTVSYGSDP